MEKRISYSHFQQTKNVAKTIDPILRQKARIQAQIDGLEEEFKQKAEEALEKLKQKIKDDMAKKQASLVAQLEEKDKDIAVFEAGIVNNIGFHVTDLVKKVIETDANGNKTTKYLPTDIVSYDSTTREYVITVPDEEQPEAEAAPEAPAEEAEAPAEEAQPEASVEEVPAEEDNNQMPWEQ